MRGVCGLFALWIKVSSNCEEIANVRTENNTFKKISSIFALYFFLWEKTLYSLSIFNSQNARLLNFTKDLSNIHFIKNYNNDRHPSCSEFLEPYSQVIGNKPRPMTSLLICGSQLVPLAANLWRMLADSAVIGILLRWREVICIQLLASKKWHAGQFFTNLKARCWIVDFKPGSFTDDYG